MGAYKQTDNPYYTKEIYIPLEDLGSEWIWTTDEIELFEIMWNEGMPIKEMAEYFGKHETTIVIVAIDRFLQKKPKIKPREGWNIW